MFKLLKKLKEDKVFRTWMQLAGSVLAGTAIIAFIVSSSINNNHVDSKYVSQTSSIAQEHNEKVDELVASDKLIKDPVYYETVEPQSGFSLTVINVGQGLSCLVECDGETLLFDGGDRDTSSFLYSYIYNTRQIDYFNYVIASHYDSDHIAGLIGILKNYKVGCVMGPPYEADTNTYRSFASAAQTKGGIVYPIVGDTFNVGSAKCTVVCPSIIDLSADENSLCLGIRITYGNTSYLLMGDATIEEELSCLDMLEPTDVYIVNHHGSSYSNSPELIEKVCPQISIISVGENDYGHPGNDVIGRLFNSIIYRTDLNGTIILESDGESIDIYTER